MDIERITAMSFSPAGGTERTTNLVSGDISAALDLPMREADITSPASRQTEYCFSQRELLVIGMPVYAGRLPNKIAPDLKRILHGNNTPAVLVISYGNRSAGDSVTELTQIMEENGFCPLGAAAIATRHVFSDKIAADRPDEEDKEYIHDWCMKITDKIASGKADPLPSVLKRKLAPYYVPLKEDGSPAVFLKAKPKTNPVACSSCGICAKVCPMGSISFANVALVTGVCIKCHACVRSCPTGAKYFDDSQFLSHVAMLERDYTQKAANTYMV